MAAKFVYACFSVFLLSFGFTITASAGIFIDRAIVDFKAGKTLRQDVKVSNDGDDVAYVKVEVLEVINPGTADEERRPVTNPQDITLLATPSKMIIPAGGTKLVRLTDIAPGSTSERVFRVNITPILPPLAEETSQVRVVVAYQVLVLMAPVIPRIELAANRVGKRLLLENKGNAYIMLSAGKQCPGPGSKADDCVELSAKRLYPGNQAEIELPYNQSVNFTAESIEGIKAEIFE